MLLRPAIRSEVRPIRRSSITACTVQTTASAASGSPRAKADDRAGGLEGARQTEAARCWLVAVFKPCCSADGRETVRSAVSRSPDGPETRGQRQAADKLIGLGPEPPKLLRTCHSKQATALVAVEHDSRAQGTRLLRTCHSPHATALATGHLYGQTI